MLIPKLPGRSWAVRAAVAAGFLALSGGVLLFSNGIAGHRVASDRGNPQAFLIVTRESLRPAFESLGEYIAEDGGTSVLFTLDSLSGWTGSSQLRELQRICRSRGYDRVILGGDETLVPDDHVRQLEAGTSLLLRAPVATLDEAYALVASWRAGGIPLAAGPDMAGRSPDPELPVLTVQVPASPGVATTR